MPAKTRTSLQAYTNRGPRKALLGKSTRNRFWLKCVDEAGQFAGETATGLSLTSTSILHTAHLRRGCRRRLRSYPAQLALSVFLHLVRALLPLALPFGQHLAPYVALPLALPLTLPPFPFAQLCSQ
eukprot:4025480-Pleurochrysis_carterae.AAC.2